jgi:hypothetical protein
MKFIHHVFPSIAIATAVAALAAPASARTDTNLQAYALEPMGNVGQHGIGYGLGYSVAKIGPVRISPLGYVSSVAGNATFHLGAAATVDLGKHIDVGVAEVQRPGFSGFRKISTDAIVGVHL